MRFERTREPVLPVPRIWGGAIALLHHSRRLRPVDLVLILGISGSLLGLIGLVREWHGALRPAFEIDLSPLALPRYTLLSLSRGLAAYLLSLGFTLAYGYWAAKDRMAERVLVPLLDVLQSIPVLGFMPGVVLALVALFPSTNTGLELAAVLMIFTGQAWNMTFSFYNSLRSVPNDLSEASRMYRMGWWQRLRRLEQTDLNFIRLEQIRIDTPRFREHVAALSTEHADYQDKLSFRNAIQAAEVLGVDADQVVKWRQTLAKLPPYQTVETGELALCKNLTRKRGFAGYDNLLALSPVSMATEYMGKGQLSARCCLMALATEAFPAPPSPMNKKPGL